MIEIRVDIPNLPKFQRALSSYPEIAGRKFQEAINKSIMSIHSKTQSPWPPGTPRATGRLASSLGAGIRFGPLWGSISTDVEYAVYVHEGTYKMVARPFLKTSVEAAQSEVERHFEQALSSTLNEIASRAKG